MLNRIEEVDRDIDALNTYAPDGENRRMLKVELASRGMGSFTASQPSLLSGLKLPNPGLTSELSFPVWKANPLAMTMYENAKRVGSLPSAGPDWFEAKAAEDERKLQEYAKREEQAERGRAKAKAAFDADKLIAAAEARTGHRVKRKNHE